MQTLKYLSAILLFSAWSLSAQQMQSSAAKVMDNDLLETPNFASDYNISPRSANGKIMVTDLASNWESIVVRSMDGATYVLIPNDDKQSSSEVTVDLSRAISGMYFCEVKFRDQRKNVKSFRLR